MARRYPRGQEYEEVHTHDPQLDILVVKGKKAPKIDRKMYLILRLIGYYGTLTRWALDKMNAGKTRSEFLKKRIRSALPKGISGVVSRRGKVPVRVLVAEVIGVEVAKPQLFLDYLGRYSRRVVKSIEIPVSVALTPEEYLEIIDTLERLLGRRVSNKVVMSFDKGRLDQLIEEGRLSDPPRGVLRYRKRTSQVHVSPLTPKRTKAA